MDWPWDDIRSDVLDTYVPFSYHVAVDGTIYRTGQRMCDSIKEKLEPKVSYDWTRLDAGWTIHSLQLLNQSKRLVYHTGTGVVCHNGNVYPNASPDETFEFHKAAREQVAKCRLSWADEAMSTIRDVVPRLVSWPVNWTPECPGVVVQISLGDSLGLSLSENRIITVTCATRSLKTWKNAIKLIDALVAKGWTAPQ